MRIAGDGVRMHVCAAVVGQKPPVRSQPISMIHSFGAKKKFKL